MKQKQKRIEQLKAAFAANCGGTPAVIARAPGRLEILGNHTDYNEGVVLSTAVDRSTYFAARKADSDSCRVFDARGNLTAAFSLASPERIEGGSWIRYIAGIVIELQKRGLPIPAFEAVILSDIPLSAGMSSSAALEMSAALAIGKLAGIELPWLEWAKIGQACENLAVGARTGLLDQFSSLRGKHGQLVFSDFRDLTVRNVPLPQGVALVVADSGVKHNLTGEYNERRRRCEEAVDVLKAQGVQATALRDISREQLERYRDQLDIITYRRALHVVGENERVLQGVAALKVNDLTGFGALLSESHESSRCNFENSCPELDVLVDIGKSLPGGVGARLSGGGFGGITVHLVQQSEAEQYAGRLQTAFRELTGKPCETMILHPADGADVM
jgi:galactokinase